MKLDFWRSLWLRKRKLIYWVVGILAFYTIIGFLILPPIIRSIAVKQLSTQLDRKVSIDQVKLNPYTFSVTIRGLLVQDKDDQPFLSWDEVYVNFQLSSIFRKEWTFGEVRIVKPYARVQMNKDYTFNFSDLVTKFSTNSAPAPTNAQPSRPLLLRVKHLTITNATVSVADFTVRTPFKRIIGPLSLHLENFHTAPNNDSPYAFAGTTDAGENFAWHGYVCLDPLRSAGGLTINDVTLNKFMPLYQDLVSFEIRSGQIGMHADYRFELSPSNRVMQVTKGAFVLRDFKLGAPGDTNNIVDVPHFSMTGMNADLEAHRAEIGRIHANGAKIFFKRGKDNDINVVEVSKPKENTPEVAGGVLLLLRSVTNAVTALLNSTNEWIGTIHEVAYTNCSLHLEDLANTRPVKLDLDNFVMDAKNISNFPDTNCTASLSLDWNKTGKISVSMDAQVSPPTADVHVEYENLDLSVLDPYLESQLNLFIPAGKFSLNGDVHVSTPTNGLPAVTFHGDTWVRDFRTVDGANGETLLKWGELHVSDLNANLNPYTVSIGQIYLADAYVNAIIETNSAINLLEAMHPAVPANTNSPVVVKAPAPASTNNANPLATLPQISIGSIVVSNAQINFTDRSLNPNVHMLIQQAGGTISGISSTELQHGDVDIHAMVGDGPAAITGHIDPFSGTLTNQIKISLTNMDLLPGSPYSGKFAGYRIARGSLNLDLTYNLVGRKLDSQNVITIDKFNFGEKVNSPDATKLPVRLGVAILKDRQGQIVLNVPVQGSLDDPKFRVGKVVMRAITDILTKVATSPFSLLGAAFGGGGEELSYEDFTPGTFELTDADKQKLDVMVKALFDRPALELQISGSVDPASDRDGLQRARFEKQLRTAQWQSLDKSTRETTTPDQIVLTPDDRSRLVKQFYDEALKNGSINPALFKANTNLAAVAARIKPPEPKHKKLATVMVQAAQASMQTNTVVSASPESKLPPQADPMEAVLTTIIPISDSDLETLAINRAQAVRTYILQGGKIEAGRLSLTQGESGALRQDGSKVYLELN